MPSRSSTGTSLAVASPQSTTSAVVSHGTLEHVADPIGSLAELRRVLRPGGWLLISKLPNRWSYVEYVARNTGRYYHGRLPNDHTYTVSSAKLLVEVSGFEVVKSWLGYRLKKRAGKKSSPLDDIRPERWTARMSDEFLELLWVLEATLAMEPELEKVLDKVVAGPCFAAADLPAPTLEQRKAPGKPGKIVASDDQPGLFGGFDEDEDADEQTDV